MVCRRIGESIVTGSLLYAARHRIRKIIGAVEGAPPGFPGNVAHRFVCIPNSVGLAPLCHGDLILGVESPKQGGRCTDIQAGTLADLPPHVNWVDSYSGGGEKGGSLMDWRGFLLQITNLVIPIAFRYGISKSARLIVWIQTRAESDREFCGQPYQVLSP